MPTDNPIESRFGAKSVPYLKGLPFLGYAHRWYYSFRQPLKVLREAHAAGDVVRLNLGPAGAPYFIFHPNDIEEVFKEPRLHRDLMRQLLGQGLFIAQTGDKWKRQRQLLKPAFHRANLAKLVDMTVHTIVETMDTRWAGQTTTRVLCLADEMSTLTVRVVLRSMFGPYGLDDWDAFGTALCYVVNYLDRRLFDYRRARHKPSDEDKRFQEAIALLDKVIYEKITECRAQDQGNNLLSMFVHSVDETGQGMTDHELRDEVISTFVAGTETTGAALTWAWHLLTSHPDTEARLIWEIEESLKGRLPSFEDMSKLRYSRMVIQETLRLYPPAWAMIRRLSQDKEIGGYIIPQGALLMVSPYITHRHPDFWDQPEKFDPERFSPLNSGGRPRFAYFPFGGGGHQCIGSEFALLEAQLILTIALQRFQVSVQAHSKMRPNPRIAMAAHPSPTFNVIRRYAARKTEL